MTIIFIVVQDPENPEPLAARLYRGIAGTQGAMVQLVDGQRANNLMIQEGARPDFLIMFDQQVTISCPQTTTMITVADPLDRRPVPVPTQWLVNAPFWNFLTQPQPWM